MASFFDFVILIFLVCLSVLHFDYLIANEVIGCGGFVISSVSINYETIKIKLYTGRGVIKYTSDCAPNNGYYFIPLYDVGDYTLKIEPPIGWSFDPMQVDFDFDGKNDICSKQTDINFVFKGFTITGKVFSFNSLNGPKGVKVILLSKLNNNVIKHNVTLEDGLFEFRDILPGKYIVEAMHNKWKFYQNRIDIDVISDNVNLKHINGPIAHNQLSVHGYSATGKVVSDENPITGVQFLLYGKNVTYLKHFGCDINKPAIASKFTVKPGYNYVCHTLSDKEGFFKFDTLPFGNYSLHSFYETQDIRFEVTPSEYDFEITHDDLVIKNTFEIGGFTVFGSVINNLSSKNKINNAKVLLIDQNDKTKQFQVNVDSTNGKFKVDKIKTSNYLVKTTAAHYTFEDVLFYISPNTPNFPIISPSKFEICGKILFKKFNFKYENLNLLVIEKESNKIMENIAINNEDFCVLLPGGNFVLKINSKNFELKFVPDFIEIKVDQPKNDIVFKQFTATITGKIELKSDIQDKSNEFIIVTLTNNKNVEQKVVASDLKLLSKNVYQFQFKDVLPGDHSIALGGRQSDLFCWDKNTAAVQINDIDISNIVFRQKGFLLQISLSHLTDLSIKSPTGNVEKLKKESIGQGQILKHCVVEVGKYQITPIGCHKFSESENEIFNFDTKTINGDILTLTAVKHRVTATILSSSNEISDLSINVTVKLFDNESSFKIALTDYKLIESKVDQLPVYQYSVSFYERPMVDIRMEPMSAMLLFKPSYYEFKLKDDCYDNGLTFQGRFGVNLNGQIIQKIEGVQIKIFDSQSDELLHSTTTDSEGKYFAGPFDDDIKLRIQANKERFIFTGVANKIGYFDAHRLSSIVVIVTDENNNPLNEVLVSLSGGEKNFRKNSLVDKDGKLDFENLHSGQYFIRFMRKEFEFNPSSKMITIQNGDKIVAKVVGKKVAFSCFGLIDSLNGEPESGVIVEAIGLRNVIENTSIVCSEMQEEATSETDGTFRILGLLPECQYAIRLKIDNKENIRESIPRVHSVRVQNSDLTNMRFIVFYKQFQTDLSASIQTKEEFLSSLNVRLFRENDPNSAIFQLKLSSSYFFFLPSLPLNSNNYILRIDSSLSSALYKFSPIVHVFSANQSFIHFNFEFNPIIRSLYAATGSYENDMSSNSLYFIPLILICIILYYNKQVFEKLRVFSGNTDLFAYILNKRNNITNNSDNANLKKKFKTKKVN